MPRFADLIERGMRDRGHTVERLTASPRLLRLPVRSPFVRKWLGYFDQFVLFPRTLRKRLARLPAETLVVVSDQALGMWVPHIRHRPHVIHCHDFLALKSALGRFRENLTGRSGKAYQSLIRRGFSRGDAFVSVSQRTQDDLHTFLGGTPEVSEVVYNGLNGTFTPMSPVDARRFLATELTEADERGFLLHVGGGQWYKNRAGVVRLYRAWCELVEHPIPMWMVGAPPNAALQMLAEECPNGGQVRFVSGLSDDQVKAAYSLAEMFLFPSLAEGFGWPIAEAMACGTAVLTTDEAPMTEVGGDAAFYHSRLEAGDEASWAADGARLIQDYLSLQATEREAVIERGLEQAKRFDPEETVRRYEEIYTSVLQRWHEKNGKLTPS